MSVKIRKAIKIRQEVNASVWYVLSNTLTRGASLLATPVFTRLLSPEEYSAYPLFVSYMGIFTVLATFEIPGAITYSGLSHFGDEESGGFMLSAFLCELMLSSAFLSLYLITRGSVNRVTGMSTALTLILIFQVFLNSAESLYFSKKRFFGAYKWVTLMNCVSGVLGPVLSIMLILAGLTGGARIISQLSISVALGAFIIYRLITEGGGGVHRKYFRYIFKLAVPILPHYLASSVTLGIDRIMISSLLGAGALGMYSVAHSVGLSVSLIGSGMQMALAPYIAKKTSKEGNRGAREALLASQTLLAILTAIFLCFAPELFRIFASEIYQGALVAVYPVAIGCLFNYSSALCVSASVKLGRVGGVTAITVESMLLSLGLNYVMINSFGYTGAALASLAVSVIRFFMNLALLCKGEQKESVNAKYYLQNTAFILVFGILLFTVRSASVSRILLFLALILILISTLKKYRGVILRAAD